MKSEYIIINKTAIQKRIEECDKEISILCRIAHNQSGRELEITNIAIAKLYSEKDTINLFLSQSTPLIPEIENAYEAGKLDEELSKTFDNPKGRYISNLKLDI